MSNNSAIDFSLLLASSIHDMKNSLSMLLHSLDIMFERAAREKNDDKDELAVLQYEATRVNSDLIQLLGLYRLQEKQLPMNIDEHSVFEMLEEQMIINERLFTTQNINITISCDEALVWYIDPVLIGGVINNVLINAVRYTESRIDICASIENEYLKIVISDNGPGYPSAMLEGPMDQLKAIDFVTGSTSLGIYFSHHIAQLHKHGEQQGHINLENGGELGGSIFTISIP